MSAVIYTLVPPCPPSQELKRVKQKRNRISRVRAVDFDNDEDSIIKPKQNSKNSKNKRTSKIDNFDEEEEEKPTQKVKKSQPKKKSISKNKKCPINEKKSEENEDYYYKSSILTYRKEVDAQKRPQSSTSKQKSSFYIKDDGEEKTIKNDKFEEISIDDYENPDDDDFEEQLISNHSKTKKTIPLQQQKKINVTKKTETQSKMLSSSKNKKASSIPKPYEYGSLGKSTLMNCNSSTYKNKSSSAKKGYPEAVATKNGKMIMGKVTTNINVKDKKQVKNAKAKINDLFSIKKQKGLNDNKISSQKKRF